MVGTRLGTILMLMVVMVLVMVMMPVVGSGVDGS